VLCFYIVMLCVIMLSVIAPNSVTDEMGLTSRNCQSRLGLNDIDVEPVASTTKLFAAAIS
jgi:hypothetical protein